MACVVNFNTTLLDENSIDESPFLTVKFDVTLSDGNSSSVTKTFSTLTSDLSPQQQLSNDISAYFMNMEYCEPDLVVPISQPIEKPTTLIGFLQVKNDLIENQNNLIADQTKQIVAGNQSNGISNAIKEQTSKQEVHNGFATNKNILVSQKTNFEINGGKITDEDGIEHDIVDTDGNKIIPMHQQAKYHAEKRIDEEKSNNTDYLQEVIDFVTDVVDDTIDTIEDVVIDDDGFNIMTQVLESFVSVDTTKIDENGGV